MILQRLIVLFDTFESAMTFDVGSVWREEMFYIDKSGSGLWLGLICTGMLFE